MEGTLGDHIHRSRAIRAFDEKASARSRLDVSKKTHIHENLGIITPRSGEFRRIVAFVYYSQHTRALHLGL